MSCLKPRSVLILAVLIRVPVLPATLTVKPTWVFVPAGSSQGKGGNCAVVQPQDGCTSRMVTGTGRVTLFVVMLAAVEKLVAKEIFLNQKNDELVTAAMLVMVVTLVTRVVL